ncbi:MAG TPA: creatininase family protein [Usitatibacter sp.]|nr:creatininase family protein [Usitatibacter sp.]
MNRAAAFLLALLVGLAARAEIGGVLLEDMTSPEVHDAVRAGKTTILVPIGGTEQNGAHMVLGKHNVRARILAERIAARLGNALVAPVVAYVPEGNVTPPAEHMRFAGTISIPADAFEKTLAGAARSFRQHGFRDVVFLPDHGGYRRSVDKVVADLNREWRHATARAHAPAEYYDAAASGFPKLLMTEGFRPAQIGLHAGLADTSLALAVDPRLVRGDMLSAGSTPGVDGDPARASAELGERGVALIVDKTTQAIVKSIRAARAAR